MPDDGAVTAKLNTQNIVPLKMLDLARALKLCFRKWLPCCSGVGEVLGVGYDRNR